MPAPRRPALPSKQQILDFIRAAPDRVGKREIARAFNIRGGDRVWLKQVMRELADDGLIARGRGRRVHEAGRLPPVGVIEVTGTDLDGDVIAKPVTWDPETPPPTIYVVPSEPRRPPPGPGDRLLARLKRIDDQTYEARTIRRLEAAPSQVLGVYQRAGADGRVTPANRRLKGQVVVRHGDAEGARSGDVVVVALQPGRPLGLRQGRVTEVLGALDDPRSLSLVAIHEHAIPHEFGPEVLAEAARAALSQPFDATGREDLRDLPLVTIDPADARDHDDAVFAVADEDAKNPGGWRLIVAIADVAYYVRPNTALDREALARGNSVYFPDRVVPMLPEALSTDVCSLGPDADKAVLAVEMVIGANGTKRRHRFFRGLMRSAARLTYAQAQAAHDGDAEALDPALAAVTIGPLYGAYAALARARDRRGPLAIELPERRVELGDDGFIAAVHPRERLDSHRLIEEFMVLANVCAAETLERRRRPCLYRAHEPPSDEKAEALAEFLKGLDIPFARGQTLRPQAFNRVLAHAKGTDQAEVVNQIVLRSQSQAYYAPDNPGHFGLALRRYAHFTSPIRRYADLVVHRSLVEALNLGPGGPAKDAEATLADIAERISATERRAMVAERDTLDRFTAVFLADRVGATFAARINGATRFGLFVTLSETGADGLIPISSLGDDFYDHDERRHALVGRASGRTHRLGDPVEVRLLEATPVTGGLIFELLESHAPARPAPRRPVRRRRRRP